MRILKAETHWVHKTIPRNTVINKSNFIIKFKSF
jgi:hypothetical protein